VAVIYEFPNVRAVSNGPSDYELEVLRFAAEGFRPKEIARRLYLSDHTVERRMRGCVEALDARSVAHAVAIALRTGLID
jgi:DNA-binding NarL/FixJ family response regulator